MTDLDLPNTGVTSKLKWRMLTHWRGLLALYNHWKGIKMSAVTNVCNNSCSSSVVAVVYHIKALV